MAKLTEKHLQYALYALIGVGVLFVLYAVFSMNALPNLFSGATPSPSATVFPSVAAKAKIEVTLIDYPGCRPCVDLRSFIQRIANASDVTVVKSETIAFQNASALIAKYGIKKVPTVIISGETSKVAQLKSQWPQVGEVKPDGTLVLTKLVPVYYDIEKQKFVGLLKAARILNSSCTECTKVADFQLNLEKSMALKFSQEEELEFNSTRGKELVNQYNLTKLPSLVITGETAEYSALKEQWPNVGSVENDGALVWRLIAPPYQELPSGKIRGIASLIALQDEKCKECYDVGLHERILGTYGVVVGNLTYLNYSVPWQQKLIDKYNITFVPTVLINEEMEEYYPFTPLKQIWEQVGSVEKDGWHVFRNITALGGNLTFKNLSSGKVETTPLSQEG